MKHGFLYRIKSGILPVAAAGLLFSCSSMDTEQLGALIGSTAGVLLDNEDAGAAIGKAATASIKAGEGFTPEQEYYVGRAVAATILQSYKIYDSPVFESYLNEIALALAINSPVPDIYNGYHVVILDTDEINAFATSGGHILVTRGLLTAAESEDALAAVLAHELSHIQLGHSVKAIKSSRIIDALTTGADAALAAANVSLTDTVSALGDSVNDIVSTMATKGYSQFQEYDADKNALALMTGAGYDPHAMSDMLLLLQKQETGKDGGFVSTHPSPQDRLKQVNAELGKNYSSVKIEGKDARYARYKKIRS
jgi:predicted Zn-dependent protease